MRRGRGFDTSVPTRVLTILAGAVLGAGMVGVSVASESSEAATHALLIGGKTVNPEGAYARNMNDWLARFHKILCAHGVPQANIRVLADAAAKPGLKAGSSTLENVRAAFGDLERALRARDQFVLFIVGHGTVTEPVGKLCLPGPDFKATELASLLNGLRAGRVVVINCASGGAEFLAKYACPGRVVISATGIPGQGCETYFAEFFLLGHESKEADRDRDGRITLLEAFNWSAGECVNWYHRQYQRGSVEREGTKVVRRTIEVQGKRTRRIFRKLYAGTTVRMAPGGDPNEPDKEPEFGVIEGGYGSVWNFRRETTELASLEDRGEEKGALHWVANKHVILNGKPGEQGAVARRVVLGRPELLPIK
jgi:hypothetical protein